MLISIGEPLIGVGRPLVGIGLGLVKIGLRLIEVGRRLVTLLLDPGVCVALRRLGGPCVATSAVNPHRSSTAELAG